MKKEELAKRFERRADANTDLEAAKEVGSALGALGAAGAGGVGRWLRDGAHHGWMSGVECAGLVAVLANLTSNAWLNAGWQVQVSFHYHRHQQFVPSSLQAGNAEDVEKYSKRTVRVTREHNEECKRLLRLMGVPVLDAPSEAEAQCAQLCKDGLVSGARPQLLG
jgi:5'-3' exonuclease